MKAVTYEIAFIFTSRETKGKGTCTTRVREVSRDRAIMQATMRFMRDHISVRSNYNKYFLDVEDVDIYYIEELHD